MVCEYYIYIQSLTMSYKNEKIARLWLLESMLFVHMLFNETVSRF
jgi:hypothetical protein